MERVHGRREAVAPVRELQSRTNHERVDVPERADVGLDVATDAMPFPGIVRDGAAPLEQADTATPGQHDGDSLPFGLR